MREDDDEFRHYVPLLRRIIILVAVITAVPVVLWTITAVVRTYVGPPKVPTFHQLASTASINVPDGTATPDAAAQLQAAMQAKLANPSATAPEANATAGDPVLAPKGPLLTDRVAEGGANVQAPRAPQTGDTAVALPAATAPRSATADGSDVFPPSPLATTNGADRTAAQPPSADETAADTLPVAAPLSGPIPLPRHRPRNIGAIRTADIGPSNVPMPRPRPDAAGAGAAPEATATSPIGFIQNLFH